jgi:hypothetical protein
LGIIQGKSWLIERWLIWYKAEKLNVLKTFNFWVEVRIKCIQILSELNPIHLESWSYSVSAHPTLE